MRLYLILILLFLFVISYSKRGGRGNGQNPGGSGRNPGGRGQNPGGRGQNPRPNGNNRGGYRGRKVSTLTNPSITSGSYGNSGNKNRPPPPGQDYDPKTTLDLFLQTQQGNVVDQCPCVVRPGSDQCITYDSRYQAATLAEAVINFPDLSIDDDDGDEESYVTPASVVSPPVVGTSGGGQGQQEDTLQSKRARPCKKPGCAGCQSAMVKRLRQLKVVGQNDRIEGLGDMTGTDTECQGYRFNKQPKIGARPPPPEPSAQVNELKRQGLEHWRKHGGRPRSKRQTSTGEQFIISCIGRGEAETDSSDSLSLCGLCWAWRRLPSNYFPTYVNELICNKSDTKCLSGWGSCVQRTRSLDVLRNTGTTTNPKWQQETISSGSCCDCKVISNSGIHALVVS